MSQWKASQANSYLLPNNAHLNSQISISLSNPLPTAEFEDEEDEGIENTPAHLNPRFLLGSTSDIRGEIGQLYAVQIASLVVKQNPHEGSTLLVGVGLKGKQASDYESDDARKLIREVLDMVSECRIWQVTCGINEQIFLQCKDPTNNHVLLVHYLLLIPFILAKTIYITLFTS